MVLDGYCDAGRRKTHEDTLGFLRAIGACSVRWAGCAGAVSGRVADNTAGGVAAQPWPFDAWRRVAACRPENGNADPVLSNRESPGDPENGRNVCDVLNPDDRGWTRGAG